MADLNTLKGKNLWWKRAFAKEDLRETNKPKSPKSERYFVPVDLRDFAPSPRRGNAAHRRRSA